MGRGLQVQLQRLTVYHVGQLWAQVASVCGRGLSPRPIWDSCPCRTHVFLLQVEDVVDGLLHVLREPRHGHAVGVRRPTLREADVHLDAEHTEPGWARAPPCMRQRPLQRRPPRPAGA